MSGEESMPVIVELGRADARTAAEFPGGEVLGYLGHEVVDGAGAFGAEF
jgi:hypothetical protein